ncbi:DUF5675 family protein [Faecalibacter rhinopitheci]|uniref:DUF5675 domain-containing protein n=1 Tax=Faecalibacter rhinopitheci TaxID=2779678 RepID=A0A8J7G515_9FLAO|nr:DUF5675 family protein [Faecalibacter rhinopitheci]MBF0596390.1 hypothetical protein [Faecalibacter rhinopitheci]
MKLKLIRSYFPNGTNGILQNAKGIICYTIELPWLNNEVRKSCIPEGKYVLVKRYSQKYGWHILLKDVPNRTYILMHPANNAKKELLGCIAPVTSLGGAGIGWESRKAFNKVKDLVYQAIDKGEVVKLEIKAASL